MHRSDVLLYMYLGILAMMIRSAYIVGLSEFCIDKTFVHNKRII